MIPILGYEIPWWLFIFVLFGAISGSGLLAIIASEGLDAMKNYIRHLQYRHMYKHRFDKKPTAKCYCIDCEHWHANENAPDEGKCWDHAGWVTADCWFCWSAEPKYKE